MQLPTRSLPYEVPSYSLTGDIVAFQRCGLQYRYYNRSSLPPSRPVQLWTGQFIHGVMEEAFLQWKALRPAFPWPLTQTPWPAPSTPLNRAQYDIGALGDQVEARLRAAGNTPRSSVARDAAYRRVEAAVNLLAPHLFPLITAVEQEVKGTRDMPAFPTPPGQNPRGDRYELTGRVDVISSVSLSQHQKNPLVQLIQSLTPGLKGSFDVILDYKGARRPPVKPLPGRRSNWAIEELQVQLYAWLRSQQPNTQPVKAGVLVYVNELSPTPTDLAELKKEIAQNRTDVSHARGGADYYALNSWQGKGPVPSISDQFLIQRAVRVVPVDPTSITKALGGIDTVISQIETCALNENAVGVIPSTWQATGDDQDCDACDFRRWCPSTSQSRGINPPPYRPPVAPG